MCGIAAELRFDDRPADAAALARMSACLDRRGPDGNGLWTRDRIGLAHRRLSIIDLSIRGAQPMADPKLGLAVVFNGIVYNYRELREELTAAGYEFFSTSDTEVLLKGYHRWGVGFVQRLEGMFAFVLVETDTGRAVLARDRLGKKPLYLAESGGVLRAASTVRALLAAGDVDTSLDPVALHHYLSWHSIVPPPRTVLNGVRKLPPATVMVVEQDGTRHEHRYWEATFERPAERGSADEWIERVRDALGRAVARRMVADVPVGVLLSGGIDSSLIVALLAQQGQRGLRTFSIGFPDAGGHVGDEFEFSDLVAETYETEHRQLRVEPDRIAAALPDAVASMSEPMVSHDAVAFFLLSEEVRKHVKVVQSGQGADEVFAGYHWYDEVDGTDLHAAAEVYQGAFFDRDHATVNAVLHPSLRLDRPVSLDFVEEHFARPGAATALDRALRLDQEVMLVDDPVKRVDNMTMAHGLEARTPFLDHELVELAAACPPEYKVALDGKGILKAAARGVLPDEVIDRRKGYFPVPALMHLEGPPLELVREALTDPVARERELFAPGLVDELLADPNKHQTPSGASVLWQLGALELWLHAHGV
ncbi:MAG: N-acetylglutaminylglutamine amidotransferase [Actinomycetota bacterium]|nr:N-acetylglutaminylglutamine amidotransferase [Actinomycetota bacterium]